MLELFLKKSKPIFNFPFRNAEKIREIRETWEKNKKQKGQIISFFEVGTRSVRVIFEATCTLYSKILKIPLRGFSSAGRKKETCQKMALVHGEIKKCVPLKIFRARIFPIFPGHLKTPLALLLTAFLTLFKKLL